MKVKLLKKVRKLYSIYRVDNIGEYDSDTTQHLKCWLKK